MNGITNIGEILNDLEIDRDAWQARAEAAEKRVQELESQLAAQAWRPVTEPPPNKDKPDIYLWCDPQQGATGIIKFDGWFFNPANYKPVDTGYYMIIPAPPIDPPDPA